MRPVRYDFPDRMGGLSSAQRELARLERSIGVVELRRDARALDYLRRRHTRAQRAYDALRARLTQAEAAARNTT